MVTTPITVTITGTNDAPIITSSAVTGALQEDGVQSQSGTLAATDADHNAVLTWSVADPGAVASHPADYSFDINDLKISFDSNVVFDDSFDSGTPPGASSPTFNGSAVSYSVNGQSYNASDPTTYLAESGGHATLSAANGVASTSLATGQPVTVDAATLKTATDGTSGLNLNQDFTVEGTFALVAPNDISEEYGLRLTDRQSNQPPGPTNGDDVLDLAVRKVDSGGVVVQLRDLNFVDNTVTVLQTIGLNTSQFQTGEQIVLRLDHVAGSNDIAASFDLVDSSGNIISIGGTPQTYSFDALSAPAQIFSDENWTRAQIIANSLTTDPSYLATDYGAFSIDPNTGDWNYSLRNGSNAVQVGSAPIPNVPQDFTVQVADDQGATATTTRRFHRRTAPTTRRTISRCRTRACLRIWPASRWGRSRHTIPTMATR